METQKEITRSSSTMPIGTASIKHNITQCGAFLMK